MLLSIAIIARDEARHIAGAIQSVSGLADEVVVLLDARTTDTTGAIARNLGAKVVIEVWRNFSAQRNLALDLCTGDWIFFLDADERVTPELYAEIQKLISVEHSAIAGYWMPRRNLFFGKPVRGGGWYPDHQLRLVQRTQARYDEARLVHELAQINGDIGYLAGHLLHLNIERLDELWAKQHSYAIQEAEILARSGRKARLRNLIGGPAREFIRRFVTLGGWRDGALGFLLCGTLAYFEGVKFYYLIKG
jgi:glycosyltransferase involved in cell wall biosynthesis